MPFKGNNNYTNRLIEANKFLDIKPQRGTKTRTIFYFSFYCSLIGQFSKIIFNYEFSAQPLQGLLLQGLLKFLGITSLLE